VYQLCYVLETVRQKQNISDKGLRWLC